MLSERQRVVAAMLLSKYHFTVDEIVEETLIAPQTVASVVESLKDFLDIYNTHRQTIRRGATRRGGIPAKSRVRTWVGNLKIGCSFAWFDRPGCGPNRGTPSDVAALALIQRTFQQPFLALSAMALYDHG